MAFKVGSRVRSVSSGVSGVATERIKIDKGHQLSPPLGHGETPDGVYEPRVDLRIEYTDRDGNTSEALIHETDAEAA